MIVIVINPCATRIVKNPWIVKKIQHRYGDRARIIVEDMKKTAIAALDALSKTMYIDRIYIVGGDGTFNDVLNWVTHRPRGEQPALMLVGGGQFCYMAQFHGLPSKHPLVNLDHLFEKRIRTEHRPWRPLRVHDEMTGERFDAALIANGIINDIVRWYEDTGKGGTLALAGLIWRASLSVISEGMRRRIGRIHQPRGYVKMDERIMEHKAYSGVVMSAIPELAASCRPFQGTLTDGSFYALSYWGNLLRLARSSLSFWRGKTPKWAEPFVFNQPASDAILATDEDTLVVDGDLRRLTDGPSNDTCKHLFNVCAGNPIRLVMVI